jgi:hypothetical protein
MALLSSSLLLINLAHAEDTVLIRLGAWLAPEHIDAFATYYDQHISPQLRASGIELSESPGRATVDSVFSRLYRFDSMDALAAYKQQHGKDLAAFTTSLTDSLQMTQRFGPVRFFSHIYEEPAPAQEHQVAGPGRYQWRSYDASDGMANSSLMTLYQDRQGNMWFGSQGSGAIRFDGQTFRAYTTEDGLHSDEITSIYQDSRNHLWFFSDKYEFSMAEGKSGQYASRFDGQTFEHFSVPDALDDRVVSTVFEDREQQLWFGFQSGNLISRFDGHQ